MPSEKKASAVTARPPVTDPSTARTAAPPEPPLPELSRRGFLVASAAGASALALPGSAAITGVECATASTACAAQPDPACVPDSGSGELWVQPWEWRVAQHGSDPLPLVVTEGANPTVVGGAVQTQLFSYNGTVPGPTVRMGGDDTLPVHLISTLSGNKGHVAFGHGSRFVKSTVVPGCPPDGPLRTFEANEAVPCVPDWQLANSLLYGPHSQHTTNLHTHGLHVSPQPNPDDGTMSDSVLLRLIPFEDYAARMCHQPQIPLKTTERVGDLSYQFRLGKASGPRVETHPPGTHWYHPHPHGGTYDQVASGMAGMLIVEGDVDRAINEQLTGVPDPDPAVRTGDFCYRERQIILQRLQGAIPAEAEGGGAGTQARVGKIAVNGLPPRVRFQFTMRPGAIERWWVLNAGVDGQGYARFMVVEGTAQPAAPPATTVPLRLLAFDGITLVRQDADGSECSRLPGVTSSHTTVSVPYMVMAPANRADYLFQVPADAAPGTTYTVWAQHVAAAVDKQNIGIKIGGNTVPVPDVLVATITVEGEPAPAFDLADLELPPVPCLIQPVADDEITDGDGSWRTRRLIYSGWGGAAYKQVCPTPAAVGGCGCEPDCDLQNFKLANSMAIDGRKFDSALAAHTMGLGTAEEWTLDNYSLTIYQKDAASEVLYGAAAAKAVEQIEEETGANPAGLITAVDHPLHIHQNPFWVTAVYDAEGNPLDWNYEPGEWIPRWQDTVRIPRNGGRVVFRARFWDYTGEWVNHCHLLQHEDWGMMQTVAVVPDPFDADYDPKAPGYEYPRPSITDMYWTCLTLTTTPQPQVPSQTILFCNGRATPFDLAGHPGGPAGSLCPDGKCPLIPPPTDDPPRRANLPWLDDVG